ncbi:helix-turn-helix transcriptional regulator [Adlercreutzia equolifaciens]|uniref:response regulator transcription factor n=1 Tax=Adlercreutzia equolifaciens TaxID=446660 RepID=UPI0023AF79B8|nr:helix-turn-helix transcriptional regulator [Adlercreutzia equolifaciens]MDE8702538.1 helix-turn-helix transcriptional regulator [Adlercreutzia equolifaciens]
MHAVASGLISRIKTFWPMLVGIVCARTALIVACYGSYSATDEGLFTDGAMLITCAAFLVLLLVFSRTRALLPDRVVQILFAASVAVAAGCSVALATLDATSHAPASLTFGLSVLSTTALSLCMFYWLRSLRHTDEVTAALFVFAAFAVSVLLVYALSFTPALVQNILGAILIVMQLALMGPSSTHEDQLASRPHRRARTFFTFARSSMQDARFLTACTVGMGCLGFVDGFLRGYPDGLPIPFTPGTRFAYAVGAVIVCVLLMVLTVRRRERVMTVGIFIAMELLASFALVLFGAFPFHWEIGAVAVNILNIVICAYCFYVIIAFVNFGDRDPYFYALAGWVVCFGTRSVARMLLLGVYPLTGNDIFINSLLGALILISTQVVLVQFLLAEHREWSTETDRREAEMDRREALADEQLRQAQADIASSEEALAQAEEALQNATRNAAEHEAAEVAAAVAAVQKAAFEAVSAAQAERCIKCTDGCSPALRSSSAPSVPGTEEALLGHPLNRQRMSQNETISGNAPRAKSPAITSPSSMAAPDSPSSGIDLSATMRQRVQAMGEQFLLSDREVDVLTLYALGYTQKKVAEELSITPATAHTHIKRIYSKCGMHSRQDILEYLSAYAS